MFYRVLYTPVASKYISLAAGNKRVIQSDLWTFIANVNTYTYIKQNCVLKIIWPCINFFDLLSRNKDIYHL